MRKRIKGKPVRDATTLQEVKVMLDRVQNHPELGNGFVRNILERFGKEYPSPELLHKSEYDRCIRICRYYLDTRSTPLG